MRVLIVEKNEELGHLWRRHLTRQDVQVQLVDNQQSAVETIRSRKPQVIILNLHLPGESAIAIADFAGYRSPRSRVIFVTDTTFFSDGSIFKFIPNACACVRSAVPPYDLCAMVEHFGARA